MPRSREDRVSGRERCIDARQLAQSFAGDLELALDCERNTMSRSKSSKVLPAVMAAMAFAASHASQSRLLGSRFKDRLP